VYPAYRRAMDGLATENAHATDDARIWRLPKGADAYTFYLHRATATNLTAEQVHQKGLGEVTRIEAEMDGPSWRAGGNCRTTTCIRMGLTCAPAVLAGAVGCGVRPAAQGALHRAAHSGV
jgi:uncharacterized protein (DUF885 family)